jgi:hypothetical protein
MRREYERRRPQRRKYGAERNKGYVGGTPD